MEKFEINTSKVKESIKVNYFPNKNKNKLIVIVGGWNDSKNEFVNILELLINKGINDSFLTFSFRGYETKKYKPLSQQIIDLKEVLTFMIKNKEVKDFVLLNTSDGAVSTTHLLVDKKIGVLISKTIYIDPADYYQNKLSKLSKDMFIWPGYEGFKPIHKTVADLLIRLNSTVTIDVMHLLLRNYGSKGYSPNPGVDDPRYFSRLNREMVRNFYDKTPKKNRGKYLEVGGIPHAFLRDGNIKRNEKKVADILWDLLKDS